MEVEWLPRVYPLDQTNETKSLSFCFSLLFLYPFVISEFELNAFACSSSSKEVGGKGRGPPSSCKSNEETGSERL